MGGPDGFTDIGQTNIPIPDETMSPSALRQYALKPTSHRPGYTACGICGLISGRRAHSEQWAERDYPDKATKVTHWLLNLECAPGTGQIMAE